MLLLLLLVPLLLLLDPCTSLARISSTRPLFSSSPTGSAGSAMAGSSVENGRRFPPLHIGEDHQYRLDQLFIPRHYADTLQHVLIPHGLIQDRIKRLARDIRSEYEGKTIHLLCVLKGGSKYFGDLVEELRSLHEAREEPYLPFTFDFIRVKSYVDTESTGEVNIIDGGNREELKGKDVLLVEDIVDTGTTMKALIPIIEGYGAASVRVTSLLEKRTPHSCGYVGDYVGFSIPNSFVVGYCLDYNEVYRDLGHICVLADSGIKKYATGSSS